MARSASEWRRLGSEAQAEDAERGHTSEISDDDLRAALATYHAVDLDQETDEDRPAALDALVYGYRRGG